MQSVTHRSSAINEKYSNANDAADNKKEGKNKEEVISFVSCDFEYNKKVFFGLLPGLLILLAFCGKLYIFLV